MLISIVIGFASGIFFRSLFIFNWQPVLFVFLLTILFAAAVFLKPRLAYSLGAAFCLCAIFGMVRVSLSETPLPSTFMQNLRHRVSYEGIVVSDPDVRDSNKRVPVRISKNRESTTILAVVPRYPTLMVGDRVYVSGTLLLPESFLDDSGRIFRYDKYLESSGVHFILNFAYARVMSKAPWYSVPALFARIKHSFLDGLSRVLPEPYASLAGGLVIGGKSGLGNELKDIFVRSGLIQIIVLSGYNVMIVAEWVMAALAFTTLRKRWSAVAGALAILIFIGVAGASATALRAALMAIIALYARATGRTYAAGRALFFVVLLMLIYNPLYLVYDPGFGLSVVATAGIIWLAPLMEILFSFVKNKFWKNAVATTLAAQIAVLPLLLYATGTLSLVSVPANLLTMPMVPLAMGLSAGAGLMGMLFGSFAPLVAIVLAFPAYLANAYLIYIAQQAAVLPFAAFTLPPFPFWLVIFLYAVLIYLALSKRFSMTLQLRFARKAST